MLHPSPPTGWASGPGGIYVPGLVDPYLDGGVASRRGGAPPGSPRTTYTGLQCTSANYYSLAAASAPVLTAGASTVGAIFRKTAVGNLLRTHDIATRWTTAVAGHRLILRDGTVARSTTTFVNDVPANETHNLTISALTQNALYTWAVVFDTVSGTDYSVDHYLSGSSLGATDLFTGYTAPTTEDLFVARQDSTTVEFELVGLVLADSTALTAAQVSNWHASLAAGAQSFGFPTGTTHVWDAADAGATWVDSVSGDTLAETGTVTPVSFTGTWG